MNELEQRANIEAYLTRNSNLSTLEDLLSENIRTHQRFAQEKRNLSQGRRIGRKARSLLFDEIKPLVNSFLGVDSVPDPEIVIQNKARLAATHGIIFGLALTNASLAGYGVLNYFNSNQGEINPIGVGVMAGFIAIQSALAFGQSMEMLNIQSKYKPGMIMLESNRQVTLTIDYAHEYDHHIQHLKMSDSILRTPMAEGHARGVELAVAEEYSTRTGNNAYLYHANFRRVSDMYNTYGYLCAKQDRKRTIPKPEDVTLVYERQGKRVYFGEGYSRHPLGVAAMQVAQVHHGSRIYRDTLKGEFDFLAA